MRGHWEGWTDGWVGEERGVFFSHDLVLTGPGSFPPLSVSLLQTGPVCDWAGSSCLSWAFWHSSLSCPPIPLPPAVSWFLCVSIFIDTHSLALTPSLASLSIDIVLHQLLTGSHSVSLSLAFSSG